MLTFMIIMLIYSSLGAGVGLWENFEFMVSGWEEARRGVGLLPLNKDICCSVFVFFVSVHHVEERVEYIM